ncbi:hypothetical protein [Halobellus sp. GM3]|uniref:hypothetical protein n=1 Tax=Halobellus sp. GM3 TaxID=3458410 RepID=UPI00403E01BF
MELVSLLLPIILVVLQFTVRYYRNEETGSPAVRQATVLISLAFVAGCTILAGILSMDFLIREGYEQMIQVSLQLLQFALGFFVIPVVVILLMALSEIGGDLRENWVFRRIQARIPALPPDRGEESYSANGKVSMEDENTELENE